MSNHGFDYQCCTALTSQKSFVFYPDKYKSPRTKTLTSNSCHSIFFVHAAGVDDVGELPTLLHFACKYGLNDLATAIIDSPGAQRAIHMDNERGLKPIHLAEENHNDDLVNYIEAFMVRTNRKHEHFM